MAAVDDGPDPSPSAVSAAPVDALGRLADEHTEAIYRVAVSIVRDAALAEDAVQETLIKAWSNLDRFRGESSERTWVLRIAHNTCISMLRKRRADVQPPGDVSDAIDRTSVVLTAARPEDEVADRAFRDAFEAALFELDDLTRSILVLRELEQLGYEEIAAALDVPLPTVKTRLLRGRRRLATFLEAWR